MRHREVDSSHSFTRESFPHDNTYCNTNKKQCRDTVGATSLQSTATQTRSSAETPGTFCTFSAHFLRNVNCYVDVCGARNSSVFCVNPQRSPCLLTLYPWIQCLRLRLRLRLRVTPAEALLCGCDVNPPRSKFDEHEPLCHPCG